MISATAVQDWSSLRDIVDYAHWLGEDPALSQTNAMIPRTKATAYHANLDKSDSILNPLSDAMLHLKVNSTVPTIAISCGTVIATVASLGIPASSGLSRK